MVFAPLFATFIVALACEIHCLVQFLTTLVVFRAPVRLGKYAVALVQRDPEFSFKDSDVPLNPSKYGRKIFNWGGIFFLRGFVVTSMTTATATATASRVQID